MNFAPYQDASPETHRALSPPPPGARSPSPGIRSPTYSPRASLDRMRNIGTAAVVSPSTTHQASYFGSQESEREPWIGSTGGGNGGGGGFASGREDVDMFETRLGLRMDYEACLAYLLLPPAGGVFLLVFEHRSDYVRFHAWQSSLLFAFMFVIHIIFSWTSIISWLLFIIDIGLIGYLTFRAYKDAETLDRFEVPFFGPLASSILDDE